MIRKLRVKFICVIMVIVMVLLGGILGFVIHFTANNMETQSINMMRRIAVSPFQKGHPGKPSEEVRLPFFVVQVSRKGELTDISGDYFDLSDQESIQKIVDETLCSDSKSGKLNAHNLRYLKVSSPRGYTIVFSDTTTETATLKNMVYSCLAIFLAAMLVFPLPETFAVCAICSLSMPLGLNTIIIPSAVGKDTKVASGMALVSHILSCLTIPVVFLLFQYIPR